MGLQVLVTLTIIAAMVGAAMSSVSDKDKQECAEQLVGLATCLPYVGGDAKSPTPDCCNGLKQVLQNDKKCLCVIVVDRNDPQLGLKINVSLALSLPSVCHAAANVSKCPELLHLPSNSADAKVFYEFGKSSNHSASSPAVSPTGKTGSGQSAQKITSGCGTTGKTKALFGIWELLVSLNFLFFIIV